MNTPNEMSVAEAMAKAREYADKDKDMPSVSRTLAAEIVRLQAELDHRSSETAAVHL